MPQSSPLLPFGEFRPDIADYEGIASQAITNVVPRGDGYGPYPSFQAFTQTLPGICRGFFSARKFDGSVVTFAATATKLYTLSNVDFSWKDVSLGGGSYSAVSGNAQWEFEQFGNLVFATQANVLLQVFDMSSSTAFANNPGSPPQAAHITVVGQFLMLSGLLSFPYRQQWSGLGDTTNWTAGVNSSDFQDYSDGGLLRGVAGGEYGVVFQDTTIRQMVYAPGTAFIFQITRITQDMGLLAPYSLVTAGGNIFFYAAQGFQQLPIGMGVAPSPIGKEKVDRSFASDWDSANPQLFLGANDIGSTRVVFAYKSISGSANLFDTVLVYDYVLQRWAVFHGVSGESIATLTKPGVSLEGLDPLTTTIAITHAADNGGGKVRLTVSTINLPPMPVPADGAPVPTQLFTGMIVDIFGVGGTTEANGFNLVITVVDSTHVDLLSVPFVHAYTSGGAIAGPADAMTVSFDSYAASSTPALSAFDSTNALGFFNGPALEAKLESSEQGEFGQRIFVDGFRPITDAATVVGSVSSRERLQDARVYSPEQPLTSHGRIPASVSTRYARGRIRIPAGSSWTYAMGVEPSVQPDGED